VVGAEDAHKPGALTTAHRKAFQSKDVRATLANVDPSRQEGSVLKSGAMTFVPQRATPP